MTGAIVSMSDLDWEAMGEDPYRGAETRWKLIFSSDRTPTDSISIGMAEIAPGGTLDLHRHAPAEVYHVLKGNGFVEIDGVRHELAPGISVFIPGNAWHAATNPGPASLRFLFIFPTNSLEDVGYQFSN